MSIFELKGASSLRRREARKVRRKCTGSLRRLQLKNKVCLTYKLCMSEIKPNHINSFSYKLTGVYLFKSYLLFLVLMLEAR